MQLKEDDLYAGCCLCVFQMDSQMETIKRSLKMYLWLWRVVPLAWLVFVGPMTVTNYLTYVGINLALVVAWDGLHGISMY